MKESIFEQIGEDGRRKVIQETLEAGKTFANRMIRGHDILVLMRDNIEVYERFFKKGYISGVIFCQITHLVYMCEAKKRGLNFLEYCDKLPNEWYLDYMERMY